jgi:ABC-type amino acid transport substrate-binding protein
LPRKTQAPPPVRPAHPLLLSALPAHAQPPQRELVIGTKEAPPFALQAPDGTWTGISIELWTRIAAKPGLHATFRSYETVPDLLSATADGKLDAALSAITVTSEREKIVDFTQPYYVSGLGIAVPMHKEIEWLPILNGFFTMRFLQAVGVLIAAAISVGSMLGPFERHHSEHFAGGPSTLMGRALAVAWMIALVIIVASFTAGNTSQLTAKQLANRVRGPSDLAMVRTGSVAATEASAYLRGQHISAHVHADAQAGMEALKRGKIDAFVYDKPLMSWIAREDFADDIEVLDTIFDRPNYAIAVPIGSQLRTRIDVVMIDDLHDPWWQDVLAEYLGRD